MTKQELLNIQPETDKKALLEKKKKLEKELLSVNEKINVIIADQVSTNTQTIIACLEDQGFKKDGMYYIKSHDLIDTPINIYESTATFTIFEKDTCNVLHEEDYDISNEKILKTLMNLITNLKVTKATAKFTLEAPVFMINGITTTKTEELIDLAFQEYDFPESLVTQRSISL